MGSVTENQELIEVAIPDSAHKIHLDTVFQPVVPNAFVILNQEIKLPNLKQIWKKYRLKICADGGANRLFDYFENVEEREQYVPDFITGDLDSLRKEVGDWYGERGTRLIKQETQYETDLGKSVHLAEVYFGYPDFEKLEIDEHDGLVELSKELHKIQSAQREKIQILLLGAVDGRFDHTIQSISLLLKHAAESSTTVLYFISNTDLIICVPRGINYIDYSEHQDLFHGSNNGLLPLGGAVTLATKGFKWDVQDWPSSISTSVSTSNRFVGENGAIVETDEPIVLSIELDFDKLVE